MAAACRHCVRSGSGVSGLVWHCCSNRLALHAGRDLPGGHGLVHTPEFRFLLLVPGPCRSPIDLGAEYVPLAQPCRGSLWIHRGYHNRGICLYTVVRLCSTAGRVVVFWGVSHRGYSLAVRFLEIQQELVGRSSTTTYF